MTDQNRPDRICEGDEQIRKKYKKRCAAGERIHAAQHFSDSHEELLRHNQMY